MRIIVVSMVVLFVCLPIIIASPSKETSATSESEKTAPIQTTTSSAQNEVKKNENEIRPWWLGDLITFLGVVVGAAIGAGMIVYQLGRQHKNELSLQKENFREKLRLEVYQEFSPVLVEATEKIISTRVYTSSIPGGIKVYLDLLNAGLSPAPLKERAIEVSKLHNAASETVIKLICLFEKYEVISTELNIFKTALNVASHDMMKALMPLYAFLLVILPMDLPSTSGTSLVGNVIVPTEAQIQHLVKLVTAYQRATEDIVMYLYDLKVELQNILLSKLVNNKVPRRQPIDPKIKVVSIEPEEVEKLQRYFENETDWGRCKRQAEQDVLSRLNNP